MVTIKHMSAVVLLLAMALSVAACNGKDKGEDMWLQAEDVCVFSAMEGTITFQGKPAVGAKVVRKVEWNGNEEKPDSVMTDEEGKFSLPVMNRVLRQLFPAEFVAFQDIFVHYQGQEYQIWRMGKRDEWEFGELNGRPANFRCELTNELVPVEVKRGLLGTSCVWDSIDEGYLK